jgi:Zn-dependent protease
MMELNAIQKLAIWALPMIFAITVHEVAHGWVAFKFGDQTARLAGRLTLNPVKHIDLTGTIIVPAIFLLFSNYIFGWAKPVPVDSRNMSHPRYQMIFVSLAGPVSNLIMALMWAGVAKIAMGLNSWAGVPLVYMGQAGIMINVVLAVLNCLPILPLDGGRALSYFLPGRLGWNYSRLEPYGFLILLLLMFSGILWIILAPPISILINIIYFWFGL